MRPRFNIVWVGVFALVAALASGCAVHTPTIGQLQTSPGRYADDTISVEGVVTTSWGIPMVPFKVYRVSDGTGELLVISDDNRTPGRGARVRVRGELNEFAVVGGRSFGLHLREKNIKYL
jgi:hypothetical protein